MNIRHMSSRIALTIAFSMIFLTPLALMAAGVGGGGGGGGGETPTKSLKGQYVGYSWRGEAAGTPLEEADQFIEAILTLDDEATISDLKMRFFVKVDGFWTTRQSGNAYVAVDFDTDPRPAVPGQNGTSMFTVYTVDLMSFYAVAVNSDGTVAAALVDPITRYQFELKLDAQFDFDTVLSELTIGSGHWVPTVRTSGSGYLKPDDWQTLADRNPLNMDTWSDSIYREGIFKGITEFSTVRSFLQALGVQFQAGRPQPLAVRYGYFGIGGWDGNYRAIAAYLKGKKATEVESLVDWSIPRYRRAINADNVFGADAVSGATRTAQDSVDTISGATVRMSRESTAYQRALVSAGILDSSEVVLGRF